MLHLAGFMNLYAGIGTVLHSDEVVRVEPDLVWPMVACLDAFTREATGQERGFRKAMLEDVQIIVWAPLGEKSPLRYVVISDRYDNPAYTLDKMRAVHQILNPYIDFQRFAPPAAIMKQCTDILEFTQEFPADALVDSLPEIEKMIGDVEKEGVTFVDFFVADMDDTRAVVHSFKSLSELKEKSSPQLFADLLTTVPFESYLWLATPADIIRRESHGAKFEGWYVLPLMEHSDFFLVAYFLFPMELEEKIVHALNEVGKIIKRDVEHRVNRRPF